MQVADADEMRALARRVARCLVPGDVVVLTGPLGAGKTTFTQGLAAELQVAGAVTSPTFLVARNHKPRVGGVGLTHVDAYRLGPGAALDDLDLDERPSDVVVIEWGETIAEQLGDEWLQIVIDRGNEPSDDPAGGVRTVTVVPHGTAMIQRFAEVSLWP